MSTNKYSDYLSSSVNINTNTQLIDDTEDRISKPKKSEMINQIKSNNKWTNVLIDEVFTNRLRYNILNESLTKMFGQTIDDIKFKIGVIIMNIIHQSQKKPNDFICVNLTPFDESYNVYIKLMYIPNLTEIINKLEHKMYAKTGLVWGIVGTNLIKHHGSLPTVTDSRGKTILPFYHSNQEIWYPFHEYKFRMIQIILELSLLYKYLCDDSLLQQIKLINKPLTSEYGLLGLASNDIKPDLTFINDFNNQFDTLLIDYIKGNPIKGLKPHKTVINSENGTIITYNFNFNQYGSSPELITNGILRASKQIPLLYGRRLEWCSQSNHKIATLKMKNELIQFQKSNCMVAILSFSRHTRILIKSSSRDTMYIIDPWKKFNNYEQNTLYQKIVKVANSINLKFMFLEQDNDINTIMVKIEGSSILAALAKAINICMNFMLDSDVTSHKSDKIKNLVNEQINDSVALITTSVMKKTKKVTFNPIIDYHD